MSKELPYFQFEPAQYLSGDIQLCSLEAQGVFINLLAIYWQRDCQLTLDQAKRRLKSDSFKELISENIIKLDDNDIIIAFLDEQYELITKRKKRLSDAGRKGAKAKKDKATLKPPLSKASATLKQPDKIREEEIIGDKITEEELKAVNQAYDLYPSICPKTGMVIKHETDKRGLFRILRERGERDKMVKPLEEYVKVKKNTKSMFSKLQNLMSEYPEYVKPKEEIIRF